MSKVLLRDAASVFNVLDGLCGLYKPAGESLTRVRKTFLDKLCSELCDLEEVPATPYVIIDGDTTSELSVNVIPSYSSNSLVTGPKYVPSDFRCAYVTPLGFNTSGLLVMGLNGGNKLSHKLMNANPLRTYRITGRLGEAKHNLLWHGRTVDRGGYKHVFRGNIDSVLAAFQSAHQKAMFDVCGVDIQSQEAYELAAAGPIRPKNKKIPVIYGMKCVEFNPPEFTLEIQSIGEYEAYLVAIIHDMGAKLRTVAHTVSIQCIAHSFFTLHHALLKKHWTLQEVINNMKECGTLINKYQHLLTKNLQSLDENSPAPGRLRDMRRLS